MAELLRTNLTAPSVPLSTKQPNVSAGKTTRALGQLAELGAKGVQLYEREHEAKMANLAMSDLVNDAVNPDMKEHEAAYAQTVAKGQAMQGYSTMKEQIANGKFNSMEPEEFQKIMRTGHAQYKEGIATSKWSDLEAAEYDKHWLQHGSTLTAAQAGMYRKYKGVQMQTALSGQMSAALGVPGTGVDKLVELGVDPKFSLLNEDNVLDTIMTTGIDFAQKQPQAGLKLLLEMQEKLHFNADPARSVPFRAAITKARKDINDNKVAVGRKEEVDLVNMMEDLVDAGNFTDSHMAISSREKRANGSFLWTPKQLRAMKTRSMINKSKANLHEGYKKSFRSGVDIHHAPKKNFDEVVNSAWAEAMLNSDGNSIQAIESMGRLLVNQTREWDGLKNRSNQFHTQLMMTGNEPNTGTMHQFKELQALERGMSEFNNGEKRFNDYLGDSFKHYKAIKDAMVMAPGTEEEKWANIAESLKLQKEKTKKQDVISRIPTEAMNVGKAIAQDVMQVKDSWIPDVIEKWMAPEDKGIRLTAGIAQVYQTAINEGWSEKQAAEDAQRYALENVIQWGGEYYDMQGVKPEELFGTSDYKGVFQTMVQDPIWNSKLKEAFGVTIGEMWFGEDDDALTEEEQEKQAKAREGKPVFLSQTEIIKEINVENGTIDFRSERGEGIVFSLPIKELTKAHEARQQDMQEIARLERMYSPEFQETEVGKAWAVKQSALNDDYLTNVLSTQKALGRTTMTPDEYVGMPDIEKTRERKMFHKNNYVGFLGQFRQIADFFGAKRDVDTMVDETVVKSIPGQETDSFGTVTIGAGIGVRHNNPGNMIYVKGMRGASQGELKSIDKAGKKTYWSKYKTPEEGFKGLVRQVGIDERRGDDLKQFISEFAPKSDNNKTDAYISYVAGQLGVSTDTSLKDINNTELAKVIARYESQTTFK